MANHLITKAYNDILRILEVTDPGHASTFNPLFKQLVNNDAYLKEVMDTIKNGQLTITELDTISKSISGAINELKEKQDALNSQMLESIGHGIVSGLKVIPQLPANMSVTITNGVAYMSDGSRVELNSNSTIAINSADLVNPRIDIIYLSKLGIIGYTAGMPKSVPVTPEVPIDSILLSGIYISANSTSITDSNIIDDRKVIETLEKLSTDFNKFKAEVSTQMADKANKSDIDTSKNEIAEIEKQLENYNSYSSLKDENGIFKVVDYRRSDATLYMKSTLSNTDIEGNYQTMTWQLYNDLGTIVEKTITWTIAYDADGDIISKVVSI